ncbi:MAG TPA: hypothetical protein VFG63_08940 [Nocardioidaceae bacterium]|nr:hypothetical protein [Nocardioidaceae bacterium]
MDLSGIIFVVLAVAWAVSLIPKALKHHDEVARTRSIDRFSTAMRVLARREPVNRRDARLVVSPRPAGTPRVLLPGTSAGQSAAAVAAVVASTEAPEAEAVRRPATRPASRRAAARAAAKRRRHILIGLVVVDLGVTGVAAFGLLPWWSVAVPVTLTLAYLYLCRRQVRHENDILWARPDEAPAEPDSELVPHRAIRVDAAYGTPQSRRNEQGFEEVSPDEDTVAISAAAVAAGLAAASVEEADAAAARATSVETVAVAVPTVDGGSLWDPLPVTLPTYVGKSRAARTVRTIDLSEPGTWTSGRSEADSRLVEEAGVAADASGAGQDDQRAVGS